MESNLAQFRRGGEQTTEGGFVSWMFFGRCGRVFSLCGGYCFGLVSFAYGGAGHTYLFFKDVDTFVCSVAEQVF